MLYALLSSLSFAVQNLSCKEYGKRFSARIRGQLLLCLFSMIVVCAVLALSGGAAAISGTPVWIALAFAAAFVVAFVSMTAAMGAGPLGLTTLIVNCCMLVTTIAGVAFWGEKMTLMKALGTVSILVMLFMSAMTGRDGRKGGVKWLALVLICFVSNGLLSILQHEMAHYPDVSANVFTFWNSLMSAGICLIVLLVMALCKKDLTEWKQKASQLSLCSLGVGLGTAGGNTFAILALTQLDAVVAFPLRQGLLVLLMWAAGRLVYHDRPGKYDWAILAAGLLGIVLMNL